LWLIVGAKKFTPMMYSFESLKIKGVTFFK